MATRLDSRRQVLSFCFFVGCAALLLTGADWPRFRGPNGAATSEEQGLPVEWGPDRGLVWKTELPGAGASSPITVGDRILLTCYTGYGLSRESIGKPENLQRVLVCLDRTSGKIIWQQALKARLPEDPAEGFLIDHGYASSTPVCDGERVYVFYGKTGALAYDLEGNQLWQADLGNGSAPMGWGSAASPLVYDGLVIFNAGAESQALVALDGKTGKEVWKAAADGINGSWGTPVLVNDGRGKQELAIAVPEEIWGLDPATGKLLWFAESLSTPAQCSSLVAHDDVVYEVSGRSNNAMAIRAGGKGDVSKTHELWRASAGSYVTSPVYHAGYLYCVSDRGVAACIKADNGEVVFKERLPGPAAQFYASPIIADGRIYAVSRFSGAYVLAAEPKFKELAHNDLGDESGFNASPIVSGKHLLLRSNRYLYCVGE